MIAAACTGEASEATIVSFGRRFTGIVRDRCRRFQFSIMTRS